MPVEDYLELWSSYYQNQLCPEGGEIEKSETDTLEWRPQPGGEH